MYYNQPNDTDGTRLYETCCNFATRSCKIPSSYSERCLFMNSLDHGMTGNVPIPGPYYV